jgi:hypothetical protein
MALDLVFQAESCFASTIIAQEGVEGYLKKNWRMGYSPLNTVPT